MLLLLLLSRLDHHVPHVRDIPLCEVSPHSHLRPPIRVRSRVRLVAVAGERDRWRDRSGRPGRLTLTGALGEHGRPSEVRVERVLKVLVTESPELVRSVTVQLLAREPAVFLVYMVLRILQSNKRRRNINKNRTLILLFSQYVLNIATEFDVAKLISVIFWIVYR